MEFPRLVYKDGGTEQRPGGTYRHMCVNNDDDYLAALANGWHSSLDAVHPQKLTSGLGHLTTEVLPNYAFFLAKNAITTTRLESPCALEPAPNSRTALEQQASDLKLRFHPSISDKKLLEKIDHAIAKQNLPEKYENLTNEAN